MFVRPLALALFVVSLIAMSGAAHGPHADLAISNLKFHWEKGPASGASPFTSHTIIEFDVTNAGPDNVTANFVQISTHTRDITGVSTGAGATLDQPIGDFAAGTTRHVRLDTNYVPVPYLCAKVDGRNQVEEPNEDDNKLCAVTDGYYGLP